MLQGSRHDRILIKEEYEKEKEQRENGKGGRDEGEDMEKEGERSRKGKAKRSGQDKRQVGRVAMGRKQTPFLARPPA